jgi:hypothetical protein
LLATAIRVIQWATGGVGRAAPSSVDHPRPTPMSRHPLPPRPLDRIRTPISVVVFALLMAACTSAAGPRTSSPSTSTTTGHSTTTTTAPTGWSSPMAVARGSSLGAVDCPSTTLCLALDDHGDAFRFDGSVWSQASPTGITASGIPSLSCVSVTFCSSIVQGADQATTWNGTAFAGPQTLPAQGLGAVGCASVSFCVSIDGVGDAYYYDGSSWSSGANDWGSVSAISCPTTSFCVSVSGGISMWDGSSWTEPQAFGITSNLTSVSCPSVTFCQVVDNTGQAETWNGTVWTGPVQVPAPGRSTSGSSAGGVDLTGVSCVTAAFCIAVSSSGAASLWNGSDWSSQTVDPKASLTSVACPSPTVCVAVDGKGDALIFR